MDSYILSVDQSTQGTKALLFDASGHLLGREDRPHRQLINEKGWVEHDPEEIYRNTVQVLQGLVEKAQIPKDRIAGLGISNQRETLICWEKETGRPIRPAIVWQCSRATELCEKLAAKNVEKSVWEKTGLPLSPFFSGAKLAWLLQNTEGAPELAARGRLCAGTVDSFLIFRLSGGKYHRTDVSNASRTQLMNLRTLTWDRDMLSLFGIPACCLPEIMDSDALFCETDLEGFLPHAIPVHAALGDSHAALFGQGCLRPGMVKATYGTGSSIMMNIGETPVISRHGLATSLAWRMKGRTQYVLEGNINYTGAVITWLKDYLGLIQSPAETENCARKANPGDRCCLVPAFSGLGAPHWDSHARAALLNMSRTTGKNEICRAALDCIAFQIADVVDAMVQDTGIPIRELRCDGGPTRNQYLMQLQSDLLELPVCVPDAEELSGIGAAYAAGRTMGVYDDRIFEVLQRGSYTPSMDSGVRQEKKKDWIQAIETVRRKV